MATLWQWLFNPPARVPAATIFMRWRTIWIATISDLAVVLSLAGCGGGGQTKSVAPKPTAPGAATGARARVNESEFKLDPSNLNVKKSAALTITATNKGTVAHSLEVEGNGVEQRIPGTIDPGSSKTLKVNLKAGRYEWYCPVNGHKAMGMKGEINVGGG